jgi:hypothetical protein
MLAAVLHDVHDLRLEELAGRKTKVLIDLPVNR